MLPYGRHWHIAKKLTPSLRENRLLWIANGAGKSDGANPENGDELEDEFERRGEQAEHDEVYALGERIRGRFSDVKIDIIARAIVSSPLELRSATDILEMKLREGSSDDSGIRSLVAKSNKYLEVIERGEKVPDDERIELEKDIEVLLENTALASAVAQAYEKREKLYADAMRDIGETSLGTITELQKGIEDEDNAKRLLQEDQVYKGDFYSTPEAWTDKEVETTLKKLNIDADKEFDSVKQIKNVEISSEDMGADGSPTKTYKLKLIVKKFRAARTIAIMEKTDFGTEETLHDHTELTAALKKQRLHTQRHLERTIMLKAVKMREGLTKLCKKINDETGGEATTADLALHLGIPEEALARRILEIEETLQQALRQGEENDELRREQLESGYESAEEKSLVLPKPGDENFIREAASVADKLDDLEWLSTIDPEADYDSAKKEFIGRINVEQKASEAWVSDRAPKLERLARQIQIPKMRVMIGEALLGPDPDPTELDAILDIGAIAGIAEIAQRVKNGSPEEGDLDFLYDELSSDKRQKIDALLLLVESPILLEHARSDAKALSLDTTENTKSNCDEAQSRLEIVSQKFFSPDHPCFEHDIAKSLEVPTLIQGVLGSIQSNIQIAQSNLESDSSEVRTRATQSLRIARRTLDRIEAAASQLDEIMDESSCVEERNEDTGTDEVARYQDGTVILFTGSLKRKAGELGVSEADLRKKSITHEQGHGIIDICMRRTGALPKLFLKTRASLEVADENGKTLFERVREESGNWEMDAQYEEVLAHERQQLLDAGFEPGSELDDLAQERAMLSMQDFITDEFINKRASGKASGYASGYTEAERGLFASYEANQSSASEDISISAGADAVLSNTERSPQEALQAMAEQQGGPNDTDAEEDDEVTGMTMTGQKIVEAQGDFMMINEFIDSNSEMSGMKDKFAPWVAEWEDLFEKKIKEPFYAEDNGDSVDEEELKALLHMLDKDFFTDAKKKMANASVELLNQVGQESTLKGLTDWFRSYELLSVYDVINAAKSAGEDVARMWKRRGERVQSNFGKRLTSWIPDNNLWFGLNYAGQLKHEFSRRSEQSELDEVKQWKDSLVNIDAWKMQEMLGRARNRDQVRALIELLVEQGRLNWNDEDFWNVLSTLSGMRIPARACRNDSELRDKWLQTTITAIWNQKDRYFDWRKQNDDGIQTGKGKFSQLSDQLANIDNGLKQRLQRQLSLWVTAKRTGAPVPEDVNPHLYEEVLHYAMRMGKMSMEQKLFYLVQGVRHGLISVDRLQALAGENGGVLSRFPLIDYFNQRNNTIPEIAVIGQRIEDPGNEFIPGSNTTLWVQMEVLRDFNTRSRILKATSGVNAENLDHEDIPTIMAQADVNTVNRLTRNISGSREKLSPEGAKNAYTGFGTKFKVLARVAEADRFGDAEVMEAAKSIAAYTYYDNVLTRNGQFDKEYSTLSWSEFDEIAPSSAGYAVKDFRNANNAFIVDLLEEIGGDINWETVGSAQHEIIRSPGENEFRETGTSNNYNARSTFATEIANALKKKSNQEKLKQVLIKHGDGFREEGAGDVLKADTVRSYFHARKEHGVGRRRVGPAS